MASPHLDPHAAATEITGAKGDLPSAQSPSSLDDWRPAVEAELEKLSSLPRNWDSYGAPPIEPTIIAAARAFMRSLPAKSTPAPLVVPMSAGNLQLEWHRGKKVLELEFETPHTIRYLQWDPQAGVEEEDAISISDSKRAADLIAWFLAGTHV